MLLQIKLMQPGWGIGCNVYVVVRLCIFVYVVALLVINPTCPRFLSTFLLSFQDNLAISNYKNFWCKLVYMEHKHINTDAWWKGTHGLKSMLDSSYLEKMEKSYGHVWLEKENSPSPIGLASNPMCIGSCWR